MRSKGREREIEIERDIEILSSLFEVSFPHKKNVDGEKMSSRIERKQVKQIHPSS